MYYFVDDEKAVYAFENKADAGVGLKSVSEKVALALASPPPTDAQLRGEALGQRDVFLAAATIKIAPLQDAEDLGDATPGEEEALKAWKRYRVALNRIEGQDGYPALIEWPIAPA